MNPFNSQQTIERTWNVVDCGPLEGTVNMEIDRAALAAAQSGLSSPTLRFFQWIRPTVTYGYLLNEQQVEEWISSMDQSLSTIDRAKRPTGGGAVLHSEHDLSFSFLWSRASKIFSNRPRECYAEIHAILLNALRGAGRGVLSLHSASTERCAQNITPRKTFSVCFEEPVCNDVMIGEKKIIGGALRITKEAVLYQGTLHGTSGFHTSQFKHALINEMSHGR